jgi:6-phosphogluconolactonase (cycloisomerase 2 family)
MSVETRGPRFLRPWRRLWPGLAVAAMTSAGGGAVAFAALPIGPEIELIDRLRDGVEGVDFLDGAFGVAMSPDGRFVYASGQEDFDLGIFERDGETGLLTPRGRESYGVVLIVAAPAEIALSPDGRHLYAAYGAGQVRVFTRDAASGALVYASRVSQVLGGEDVHLSGAVGIAVSPDGRDVYVASRNDDAVAHFRRDGASGALTFGEAKVEGEDGVSGLDGAYDVAVSPDGLNVYATARDASCVVVFDRNLSSGRLRYRQSLCEGGGIYYLAAAEGVTVSADGRNVYVVGSDDDGMMIFRRNRGGLLRVEDQFEVRPAPHEIVLSPVDDRLYVLSTAAVAAFPRNFDDGTLGIGQGEIRNNQDGVTDFRFVTRGVVSPDGRHLYVTVNEHDSLVTIDTGAGVEIGGYGLEVTYRTAGGLAGTARPTLVSREAARVAFTNPANVEVLIKVLDGCAINDRVWVFAAGLTNVELTITLRGRDGAERTYVNPLGQPFAPLQDTSAFPCN